ncbi:hypothetical protein KCU62_g9453, partial [Aureobasidium sp. EXF-3399]
MVTLPFEILLEIAKCYPPITKVQDPDDVLEEYNIVKNTLASLCLVSKAWRDIAQPLLYRTYIKTEKTDIGIDHDEYNEAKIDAMVAQGMDITKIPEEEFEYTDYRKPIPLEMFIRTILERPDLAEQVECLSISNYWDESERRPYGRTDVNKALGEAMYNASLKVPPQKTPWEWRYPSEWQEDWRNELREGDEVAEVALLMVLSPNIRFLNLGTSSKTFGAYVQDLWRQLLGSQSKETRELYGVSEDALACIVDDCKQLECLDVVYSEWSRWTGVTLGMPFLVTLALRKDTLKRLTLLLPPSFKLRNHHSNITAPFDLHRLTNLVTLSIDYAIIFSERESRPGEDDRYNPKFPKNLPRSIEQLHIQCCRLDQGMAGYALLLLEARRRYNKLKTLQVTYETFEAKNAAEKKQMISLSSTVRLFKDYGLELRIESEEGQFIVPAVFEDSDAAKKYRKFVLDAPDSDSDDWDDVDSDDDLDIADDADEEEDEDNDNDNDVDDVEDEMDEGTHTGEQGRYNLRPR